MATIYNIAGTTAHSFTLGDGVTIFYGLSEPTKDMGKVGDIYVRMTKRDINEDRYDKVRSQQELQDYPTEYQQETGSALPVGTIVRLIENNTTTYYKYAGSNNWTELFGAEEPLGRVYYKEAFENSSRWNFIKSYSFDTDIIHAIETSENSNDFRIALESADNSSSASSTQGTDYSVNHSAYGVTRYASDTEVIPSTGDVTSFLNGYKTYDTTAANFPTIYDNYSPDKFIAETPNQVASNIEVEMKRALKTEGKLSTLTTRTSEDLVHAINELDSDLGTVTTAMTAGTALGGKTISTGNNTDVTAADAISTLNTKAGVLTSLTTDEKNTLVGAINEVDAHTDTNTSNIGTITSPMANDTALAGKTIATGNNTDITVANAISTLNTAVKTNSDHIGDLGDLDTAASDLVTAINNEATRASGEERDLQEQIDAITSKSDVVDIVRTYAELTAYNTYPLNDNDILKVLEDSTDNNATTYYRLSPVPTTPDYTVQTESALPSVTSSDKDKIAKVISDGDHGGETTYYECRDVNGTYEWVYASPSKTDPDTHTTGIDADHIWDYIGQEGSYYTKSESNARYIETAGDTMDGTLVLKSGSGAIDATNGSITVPTQQQSDNSTKAASTAYVRSAISAEDALVVHNTGNETIAGTKTFSTTPVVGTLTAGTSNTSAASTAFVGTAISNADALVVHLAGDETITGNKTFQGIITLDSNSYSGPKAFMYQGSTGTLGLGLYNSSDEWSNNNLYFMQDDGTVLRATTNVQLMGSTPATTNVQPTDTNSTSSTQIATVGWISDSTKSTNVVHRDSAETITGAKTFTGAVDMTGMGNDVNITVKTQSANDNSTNAASTAYVDAAVTAAVGPGIPAISSSTNNKVLSNDGSVYYWKNVKDISTLDGLEDTVIASKQSGQVLIWDSTAGTSGTGAWVNGSQVTATIRYY